MPKGGKRVEMKNETTTIVNCNICDYRITKKRPIPVVRKYLKLHYKAKHHINLTDKDIDDMAKHSTSDFKSELGNVEGLLLEKHNQAIEDFKKNLVNY